MSLVPRRQEFRLAGDSGGVSALIWDEAGRDAPAIVFLHANGFNGNTYRQFLSQLAGQAFIVAPDMRGHGRTTLTADWRTLRSWYTYRDDLNALRDGLGSERQLFLAGHSLGASTALLSALTKPHGIAGLFLIEPVIIPPFVRRYMSLKAKLGLTTPTAQLSRTALRRRTSWPSRSAIVEAYAKRGVFRWWPEDAIGHYIDGGTRAVADGSLELSCNPQWEAATYRAQAHDLWTGLGSLTCPVFVLAGTIKSTCPPAVTSRLKSRLKHAEIQRVTGASHFLPIERPELAANELRQFLLRHV